MSLSLKFYAGSILLICFISVGLTTPAQSPQPAPTRATMIKAAKEIIAGARYCTLITLDASGRANSRTMDPFPPEDDMVVWFATNPRSRKVREIRRNSRVTIQCFDPKAQDYVSLKGTARLINDSKEKARRWKDDWKAFYPDRDKSYLLIAVKPERLEVVSEQKRILGDPATWEPPSITFDPK